MRSIGLSNWYVKELTAFLPRVKTPPALVQNEIHPFYQEQDVVPFIQKKGIAVQSWYPLGGRGWTRAILTHPTITGIAERLGKTPAQVVLRWHLERGVAVIPGSSDPAHIRENAELFEFSLTKDDLRAIATLIEAKSTTGTEVGRPGRGGLPVMFDTTRVVGRRDRIAETNF